MDTNKGEYSVALEKIVEKFQLRNLTPDVNIAPISITNSDINRPALQFAGYFEQFDYNRVQLVGKVEHNYLLTHEDSYVRAMTHKIFEAGIPCIIFCRGLIPNPIFIELNFITICEKALNKGKDTIELPERLTSIYMLHDSPISKAKAKTSLYKLAGAESSFSAMSLHNDFNNDYFDMIKSRNLKEYTKLLRMMLSQLQYVNSEKKTI